nr:MAG TPA: hypothetical protein [Bacteriophage sp.]
MLSLQDQRCFIFPCGRLVSVTIHCITGNLFILATSRITMIYIRELTLLQQRVFDRLLRLGLPTSRSFITASSDPASRGYLDFSRTSSQ